MTTSTPAWQSALRPAGGLSTPPPITIRTRATTLAEAAREVAAVPRARERVHAKLRHRANPRGLWPAVIG